MRSQKHSVTVISNSAGAPVDRRGFTLVELLVVIAIIGILMGIAVPAIFGVIETAKSTKQRLELSQIEQAIERYQEKYGDYPPDFSDWTVVERHYRKIFPRIETAQLQLLQGLLAIGAVGGDITPLPLNASTTLHDASRIDRAEALVWTLGGYSSNPLRPFTGDGGPLSLVPGTGVGTVPAKYQINLDRDNALFEFDQQRLDLAIEDKDALIGPANYWYSKNPGSPDDLFPQYRAHDDGAPFVYFDSRTYSSLSSYPRINQDSVQLIFNLFNGGDFGSIRPYVGTRNSNNEYQFVNPESFQVIAPGTDGSLGYSTWGSGSSDDNPGFVGEYYCYPTGKRIGLQKDRRRGLIWKTVFDESSNYQEPATLNRVDHPQQDNLTNFADGKLIDEVQE